MKTSFYFRQFSTLILLFCSLSFESFAEDEKKLSPKLFPVPEVIRHKADFWKKVYTQIDDTQGYLHDSKDPRIIYSTIKSKGHSRRKTRRKIRKEKEKIRSLLRSIARKSKRKKSRFTAKEQDIIKSLSHVQKPHYSKLARQIRFQRGMSNRYLAGLMRSFLYINFIKDEIAKMKMPEELAYLPHVESSFNYKAYSRVGAAGIWQFMRSTARLYKLKSNYVLDERRDPIRSTRAALRYLRDNHRTLKTWPLALTAYNHGPNSIKRAVRKVGSRDIGKIIESYRGRRFGFASKNFYATFIAASELHLNYKTYFPKVKFPEPVQFVKYRLPKSLSTSQLLKVLNLKRREFQDLNLAIRGSAFKYNYSLPRGQTLYLPPELDDLDELTEKIKKLPVDPPLTRGHIVYRVQRGESLYLISKRFRVSLRDIIKANKISNPSTIFPGKKLLIPKKTARRITSQKSKKIPRREQKRQTLAKMHESSIEAKSGDLRSLNLAIKNLGNGMHTIVLEVEENLSLVAEWAQMPLSQLRAINKTRNLVRLGQKLKVPLSLERYKKFQTSRVEYHLALQEDFFNEHKIVSQLFHRVRSGDTLEGLSRKYSVPIWLLKWTQKSSRNALQRNQRLKIPVVEERS